MKGSMRAAAALAVGYFLGRQHRLRTAVLLAAATAVGGSTVGGMVLRRGMKMASSTEAIGKIAPQLTEIVDTVRDDLLDAAKAAAAAAVTNQLDTLTDSLHERADRLRDVGAGTVEDVGEAASGATGQAAATGRAAAGGGRRAASGVAGRAASTVGGAARRATGRRRPAARDEDEYEADEYESDEYESDEYEAEEPADEAGEADEYEAESEEGYEPAEGEEEEVGRDEEPVKVPAQRTAARRRSPVTRARR